MTDSERETQKSSLRRQIEQLEDEMRDARDQGKIPERFIATSPGDVYLQLSREFVLFCLGTPYLYDKYSSFDRRNLDDAGLGSYYQKLLRLEELREELSTLQRVTQTGIEALAVGTERIIQRHMRILLERVRADPRKGRATSLEIQEGKLAIFRDDEFEIRRLDEGLKAWGIEPIKCEAARPLLDETQRWKTVREALQVLLDQQEIVRRAKGVHALRAGMEGLLHGAVWAAAR